jgi:hypothetical protein
MRSGGSVPVLEADHTCGTQLDHGDHEQIVVAVDKWLSKRGAKRSDHLGDGVAVPHHEDDVT